MLSASPTDDRMTLFIPAAYPSRVSTSKYRPHPAAVIGGGLPVDWHDTRAPDSRSLAKGSCYLHPGGIHERNGE
jgi:hypothetical protein